MKQWDSNWGNVALESLFLICLQYVVVKMTPKQEKLGNGMWLQSDFCLSWGFFRA